MKFSIHMKSIHILNIILLREIACEFSVKCINVTNLLKLSAGYGFWSNLRNTDAKLHKFAVSYQRCLRRKQKAELDVNYFNKCKEYQVYPKFVKWKNIAKMKKKAQGQCHRLLLNDAIKDKNSAVTNLTKKSLNLHE